MTALTCYTHKSHSFSSSLSPCKEIDDEYLPQDNQRMTSKFYGSHSWNQTTFFQFHCKEIERNLTSSSVPKCLEICCWAICLALTHVCRTGSLIKTGITSRGLSPLVTCMAKSHTCSDKIPKKLPLESQWTKHSTKYHKWLWKYILGFRHIWGIDNRILWNWGNKKDLLRPWWNLVMSNAVVRRFWLRREEKSWEKQMNPMVLWVQV